MECSHLEVVITEEAPSTDPCGTLLNTKTQSAFKIIQGHRFWYKLKSHATSY